MSLINVWLRPDSALVTVDTACTVNGKPAHTSKMLPLCHINSVLACRGSVAFLAALYTGVLMAGATYDATVEAMPRLLREAMALPFQQIPETRHDVVLVGWSQAQGRAAGQQFIQMEPGAPFQQDSIDQEFVAPWKPSMASLPDPNMLGSMIELAKAQVEALREEVGPDVAAGGRMVMATVTEGGMWIAPAVHTFPEAQAA